jgi:uncharacterized protein (DUF1697 family)
MKQYVAFLRAINVGGHAIVPMSDLRDAFAAAGCQGVRTYIQSGNVIFGSPEENPAGLFQEILVKLRELLGQEPGVLFRAVRELERLVERDPFRAYAVEPDIKRYVAFLSQKPRHKPRFPLHSAEEALEAFALKNLEVFIVSRRKTNGFYGFPNNFIEKALEATATSRNWSTLTKIVSFLKAADA